MNELNLDRRGYNKYGVVPKEVKNQSMCFSVVVRAGHTILCVGSGVNSTEN